MKKTIIALCMISILIVSVGIVMAVSAKNQKVESSLPEDLSYTTYHGKGIWSTTHILRKDDVKPEKEVSKKPATTGPKCYKLMGVKWSDTPDYVAQTQDLLDIAEISIGTWDGATNFDLLGDEVVDELAGFGDINNPIMDEKNSYSYGDYPLDGVIAVCRTWWNADREIIEYDIMFDTDFTWGDATESDSVMDLQNIATHEIGHAFGLSDLYTKKCVDQTMYGYSDYGETNKQTLGTGDINGIRALYGI
ncbi:MAG: matrixin family metalloprotease [archaeon]